MCITEGLINQVVCIDESCSKTLKASPTPLTKQDIETLPCTHPRHRTDIVLNPFCLLPSTLTHIFPSNPEKITRYARLVKQKFYERTSTTIYCPLERCQTPIIPPMDAHVVVCPRCSYPFCYFCRSSWHGLGAGCKMQKGVVEKFMEGDEETKKRILAMYGDKLVQRLLDAWKNERENERLCQEYLNEHTVNSPSMRIF